MKKLRPLGTKSKRQFKVTRIQYPHEHGNGDLRASDEDESSQDEEGTVLSRTQVHDLGLAETSLTPPR